MIDPWEHYPGYRDHVSPDKLESFREEAQKLTKQFPSRAMLMRKYSVDAAKLFGDGALDFVYIDGNHNIQNVIADLAAWTPKVRSGGIIAGHDYRKPKNNIGHHVVEAVNAWTYANRISPWFVLGRKDEPNRDQNRSWLWVKA
jgi:predicted O-methyltransferase YrrM